MVQEALTNVLKHAGPARATVLVAYTVGAVELEISDTPATGRRAPPPARKAEIGHGLIGMRERLALYGGELSHRPAAAAAASWSGPACRSRGR